MLAVKIPEEIEDRFDALVRQKGGTPSDYLVGLLIRHLEDIEDIEDAQKRLADLKTGRSASVSLEEVMDRYGMAR